MKSRRVIYLNYAVIALLLFITIYQYNRIADFKSQLGLEFQHTVRGSIFLLENDGDPNIWIRHMKEKEGEFWLAAHIGEITILSRQYYMMNGKISLIGDMLDSLANQYRELAMNLKNGRDYRQNEAQINEDLEFLISLFNEIDSISGENERRYYKEFTNTESNTSNLVWKEYKKYEKR
ncbi:hypothetical protein [Mesobacillus jeotgali]|uniref:Uncharacterized protein n=1 Tax=Mesobacillus jeotgali TaxID=129985 RepID=A0ABY9VM61_9BACI|nr:hypothetical protein [Mesobacillus jeotgali]WNF24638.1 hypothetical protein RH061_09185 [Mesobacillus jeotgali]